MKNSLRKFKCLFSAEDDRKLLKLCDANLLSEDGYKFDVHRFQLAQKSEYFRALFCGLLSEDCREFTIPGISRECLAEVLYYLYKNDFSVTEHNIADLLVDSDYFLLAELNQHIKGRVITCLTTGNALKVFAAAEKINDRYVSDISFRFIQTRFETVVQVGRNELTDLPFDVLHKILSNKSISGASNLLFGMQS